ncbi:MAG: hypothetical protein HDT04_01890 [Bacteroidales bacterium]|nr:hypothetical protein [Bacteroidales bacterium]
MAKESKSGIFGWIILGLLVAAIAVGALIYMGWFDEKTHVDTPAGDNVMEQYEITEQNADQPGEADWQNADHQSLREIITEPNSETETPVSAETPAE